MSKRLFTIFFMFSATVAVAQFEAPQIEKGTFDKVHVTWAEILHFSFRGSAIMRQRAYSSGNRVQFTDGQPEY